jgi:hypothetical protein
VEIATLGSSSWMPHTPQGVKGLDDDELGDSSTIHIYTQTIHRTTQLHKQNNTIKHRTTHFVNFM